MTNEYLAHPSEEALERFLLNRSEEQELEIVETHILACGACTTRLETLESQITDLNTALVNFEEERIQKELRGETSSWKSWFTVPKLSWAGAACAALAAGLVVVPEVRHHVPSGNAMQVAEGDLSACSNVDGSTINLAACRGTGTATLPVGRPLDLHLDASDIPQGEVDVQLVDASGAQVWQGKTKVGDEKAEVKVPQISQAGPYFLRFYTQGTGSERELLREFRFETK